jgi:hypothetical protein
MARGHPVHTAAATSILRVFSPRRAISTLVALGRGLEEVYSVPQTLPDSIARALARLESATKTNPAHGINERPSGEGVADSRGPERNWAESDSCLFFSLKDWGLRRIALDHGQNSDCLVECH